MTAGGTPPGKAWSGRFTEGADPTAEAFTVSLSFDRRLWPYDLTGSAAWARALARAKLITEAELDALLAGLDGVRRELEGGTFPFRRELEDIHMNVERRLVELAGSVGGKLHTGRSRNDQIALDERLYLRDVLGHVDDGLREIQAALLGRAEEHVECRMPGYTHLQRAQPVLLAHHLLAYVFMLARDRDRFRDCRDRVNVLPLGSGALAGAAFPIDREVLARELGFSAPSPNSMDAVADRDFILEFLAHSAIFGMHLSRLSADLTLWATAEFGFVEFSDAFATGSSIMPQKKNPDVAELLRGKTGRLYGNLHAALVTMKGLPLSYNSDMQEDKPPLFDTVDTLEAMAKVVPPMVSTLVFHVERMSAAAGLARHRGALIGRWPLRRLAHGVQDLVDDARDLALRDDEIAASERAVGQGRAPERPFVLLAQHSLFDPSRAPEGKHTAWAYCHVPNGSTVDMTERIEAQIERFAPGFGERVLARSAMGPADLERRNANLVGGDIAGGSNALRQLIARPALRPVPYSTPIEGVYLCSASTPPGGGVHGMCGYLAARAALRAGG